MTRGREKFLDHEGSAFLEQIEVMERLSFKICPRLNSQYLAREFGAEQRVHAANFLIPGQAEAVARDLRGDVVRTAADNACLPTAVGTSAYEQCIQWMKSGEFREFMRHISGAARIEIVEARGTRSEAAQHIWSQDRTRAAHGVSKSYIGFELNLTHQWRPEWGGMLECEGVDASEIDATMPCFNCLDVFALSRTHWIGQVMPYALSTRYSIAGLLRVG